MKQAIVVFTLFLCLRVSATDWLIDPSPFTAKVTASAEGREIELNNGLVRRTFRLQPNAATVAFDDLVTGESLLRSVRPEALVEFNGRTQHIGGLTGQPIHNYLAEAWLDKLKAEPGAFEFKRYTTGKTVERFPWQKRREWMPADAAWPPPGVSLTLEFTPPTASGTNVSPEKGVTVEVHYELYDGIPLVCKWLVIRNGSNQSQRVNSFTCETLAMVEGESSIEKPDHWRLPNIHIETDYAFGGSTADEASASAVHWLRDPTYNTQVSSSDDTVCLLECRPTQGPDQILAPGASLESFRVFELVQDSTERERQGLAQRRMYRLVAPWVTEDPVLMHVTKSNPEAVRLALDQCAATGFEMLILSFGSGLNLESRDTKYQAGVKDLADYARSKGIAMGGYSLLASRGAGTTADNTVGPARFGVSPCLAATWGADYLAQLKNFITGAGLGVLEHDGSYPGDTCAATNHPFHHGFEDSQWVQWRAITDFYRWCLARGVYLNIPDWYFLNGGTKTGMGYREGDWSLPREYQEIIERQNIFDGTWGKTPSMGWMMVPLTEYGGGGAAATIEPLSEHLPHYEQRLANLFGAGVIACYRGPRLYDTEETRAIVKRWVDFFKQHRAILTSDIIHLRRPDGRDLDYILHVNPALKEKGLLMVYNPLPRPVSKTIAVPLYYTGLHGHAKVREKEGRESKLTLDATETTSLPVTIPAKGVSWFVFE